MLAPILKLARANSCPIWLSVNGQNRLSDRGRQGSAISFGYPAFQQGKRSFSFGVA